ncbi:MAG TPA: type II secretion system protein [Tepidisphaeraceae bacterium]|nr:type II secretion system protein [Tepidisphaeraceae bacterium]
MNGGFSSLIHGSARNSGEDRRCHRRLYAMRARGGFTLIEALTTMIIMAIILPVAMHGISLTLEAAELAKRTSLAATLADGKLNELAASTQLVNSGTTTGDFSPDYPTYQWQATTTSLALGLEQIDVRVTWTGRDGQRSVTVSTVVYPQVQS